MKRPAYYVFFLILLFSACTTAAPATVEIPTLMVLSSENALPSSTPTDMPSPVPPSSTPTESPSPLPSDTPLPTSTPAPACSTSEWWDAVEPFLVEFVDVAEVASSTPRASLAPIILELQRTWRSFERVTAPDCYDLLAVARELSRGMESAVQGYNDFLASNNTLSEVYFGLANQYFYNAYVLAPGLALVEFRYVLPHHIWGGEEGSDERATQMSLQVTEYYQELTATKVPSATATTRPTRTRTPALRPTRTVNPTRSQTTVPFPLATAAMPPITACDINALFEMNNWLLDQQGIVVTLEQAASPEQIIEARQRVAELPYPQCMERLRVVALNLYTVLYNATSAQTQADRDRYSEELMDSYQRLETEVTELLRISEQSSSFSP